MKENKQLAKEAEARLEALKTSGVWNKRQKEELLDKIKRLEEENGRLKEQNTQLKTQIKVKK